MSRTGWQDGPEQEPAELLRRDRAVRLRAEQPRPRDRGKPGQDAPGIVANTFPTKNIVMKFKLFFFFSRPACSRTTTPTATAWGPTSCRSQ